MHTFRGAALLVTGLLMLYGCGTPPPPADTSRFGARLVAELAPQDTRAVADAANAFAFDLFGEVADGEGNTVTAPLSMTVLLAMLLAGADGRTADEIAEVLHLTDSRDVRVGALLRTLAGTDEVKLSVASSFWARPDTPFEEDYQAFLKKTLDATTEQADFGTPETARRIDEWAAKNTGGLIDEIAEDLGLPDERVMAVLLNAVHFLGEWTTRFDPAATRPEPFSLPGKGTAEVPMMHLSGATFGHAQRDGYRMLRLPYGEQGRFGMEILLPGDGTTLPALIESLDAAEWRAATASLQDQKIDELALPRFETRWGAEMTEPLQRLGMTSAFTAGRAGFRPMTPVATFVGTVVQKTYLRVDESGTEAAAVSGATLLETAALNPTVFRADRPFAFTISDRETGAVLFLGAVNDPRT